LHSAERDNSQIYHEIVLPEHQLKPPEKQAMVKPIPLEKEKFILTVDPFAVLIPTNVKKAESLYSVLIQRQLIRFDTLNSDFEENNTNWISQERKAEMLREITKEIEDHNETVKKYTHRHKFNHFVFKFRD
jgi:hypothetical protein